MAIVSVGPGFSLDDRLAPVHPGGMHRELTYAGPIATAHGATSEPQIAQVLAVVGEVLGTDVVGAYLYGSSILGGLRPHSDLDILVVSGRPITREEKQRFVDRLLTISRPNPREPGRPVELTIVVQSQVRPWRNPPRFDFMYGDWLRREYERGNIEPWPTTEMPDLASLITMVRLANTPLVGPPPAETLDPVPHGDYMRAIVGDIDRLLGYLDGDTGNVLLTLARIWSTVATDAIRPKDMAADWALVHLPREHRPVVARARAIYLGTEGEHWDDVGPDVRACAEYMVGEITRATKTSHEPTRRDQ
jgi:predicted nucleotidyltransferase